MKMTMTATGLVKLRDALKRAAGAMSVAGADIVRPVAEVDVKQNVQTFSTEGVKSGQAWAALTPGYAARKAAAIAGRKRLLKSGIHKSSAMLAGRPKSMKKLVWSGAMKRSLTAPSDKDRIARPNGDVIELGTKHRLARFHQDGTPRMKARPPVRKSTAQHRELQKAITRAVLLRAARAAGWSGNVGLQIKMLADSFKPDPRL